MTQEKPFVVRLDADGFTIINHKGKARPNGQKMLEKYVTIFNRQPGVFATGAYVTEKLFDSSYFLTLVARMVDAGDYEAARAHEARLASLAGSDLEREFMRAVEKATRRSQNPERDTEIIAFYYGFRQDPSPSQVDAAERFGIADRERVRQIIRDKFEEKVDARDFTVAAKIADLLDSLPSVSAEQFLGDLREKKIVGEVPSARGLLDLLRNCLRRCYDVELYTPELDSATREKWGRSDQVYLIRDDLVDSLKTVRTALRGIPGTTGVARFEDATEQTKALAPAQVAFMRQLLVSMPHAWTWEGPGGLWYLFEDKQNPLMNLLRKIHFITDQCSFPELTASLCFAINPHPPADAVATWLQQASFVEVRGDRVRFSEKFEKSALTDPEAHVREFLAKPENLNCAVGPLVGWLLSKGYPDATCQSAIYRSGIVFADKSAGRGKFTYRLIGQSAVAEPAASDGRYFDFRQRLKTIGQDGTDREAIVRQRREQATLKEWLFGGKTEAACAACGRVFNHSALVTAHKKPRHDCNEAERLDPHIVMPLCVFGCDYLYERGHIYVAEGTIRAGKVDQLSHGIRQRVNELHGTKVAAEWTQGLASYFRRPR